jgi:hypothetical protein
MHTADDPTVHTKNNNLETTKRCRDTEVAVVRLTMYLLGRGVGTRTCKT